jgi:hypothetical protein
MEPGLFESGIFDGGDRTCRTAATSSRWRSTKAPARI